MTDSNQIKRNFLIILLTILLPVVVIESIVLALESKKKETLEMNGHSQAKKEKTLDFERHKIYYEVRGNAEKTLVFIHGWTSNTNVWEFQLDAFPGYKTIAIDLPGNGKSSKDEKAEYTTELFARSVKAVLDEEKIPKAFFFGHSMGFAVTEVIAQMYPDICAGIGCIDGAHFEVGGDEQSKKAFEEYNRMFAESMKEEKGREDFINMLLLPDTPELLRQEVFAASRQVPLSIGRSMINGVVKDIKYWAKRKMNIPCIAIHSPVYQLTEQYKADFMAMYPLAEYHEIPNVSHFLMLEAPYKVNQLISDYLKKVY